jgi:hypothetical protein
MFTESQLRALGSALDCEANIDEIVAYAEAFSMELARSSITFGGTNIASGGPGYRHTSITARIIGAIGAEASRRAASTDNEDDQTEIVKALCVDEGAGLKLVEDAGLFIFAELVREGLGGSRSH